MKKLVGLILILSLLLTSLTGCILDTAFIGLSVFEIISGLINDFREQLAYDQYGQGGKYDDALTYKFTEADKTKGETLYSSVSSMLDSAAAYDASKHAIGNDVGYDAFESAYLAFEDFVTYVDSQSQVASLLSCVDIYDEDINDECNNIIEYYTTLESMLSALTLRIYDSQYRDYYFYGMSDDEISSYIRIRRGMASEEYVALTNRNLQILTELENVFDMAISGYEESYEEYFANNNQIAKLLGFENYMEYAYSEIYGRDYSYADIEQVERLVKENISDYYVELYNKFSEEYYTNGLFSDYKAFKNVDRLIDKSMFAYDDLKNSFISYTDVMGINQGGENGISFRTALNGLMTDGNLFFGDYEGAYVSGMYSKDSYVPFVYFGEGYNNSTTVAHEFGHYINEVYNQNKYIQSYDILEMHSQGNEMLYLDFLSKTLDADTFNIYEQYILTSVLESTVVSLAVNCFERAVYTGEYNGTYSATIMDDGVIKGDEYEKLYKGILIDLGIYEIESVNTYYWELVVFSSPCYYISYAVSGLVALELYISAQNDDGKAEDSYFKLFTYTDSSADMTTEQILEYAGLSYFDNDEFYLKAKNFLKLKCT